MATITKNHKEIRLNNELYFAEQYANGTNVLMWRYGYYIERNGERTAILLKDALRTRPNLKKIFS